jgi:hypothetical protein
MGRQRFAPDGVSDPEVFWKSAIEWRDAVEVAGQAGGRVVPDVPKGFWRKVWQLVSGY